MNAIPIYRHMWGTMPYFYKTQPLLPLTCSKIHGSNVTRNQSKKLRIESNLIKHFPIKIIHEDQTGFISGHRIQDGCMMLAQILENKRVTPSDGGLYFLDQEKAYDRVDWSYLSKCLQKFGFGPRWMHLIGVIYGKLRARVLINGFQSLAFNICQGVHQGDPPVSSFI